MKEPKKPIKPREPVEPTDEIEMNWRLDLEDHEDSNLEDLLMKMPEDIPFKEIFLRREYGGYYDDYNNKLYFESYWTDKDPKFNKKMEKYAKDLETYKTKLSVYKAKMAVYKKELEDYQKWWKTTRIDTLKKELEELENAN